MKPTEAAALLTIAAAFDNRKADADAAKAWALLLDGLRFEDCRDAVVAHYRTSSEWLMPEKVIAGVKRIRSQRLRDFGPFTPPARFADDPAGELEWTKRTRERIADGELTDPNDLEEGTALYAKRDVIAELGHIGREVPDA